MGPSSSRLQRALSCSSATSQKPCLLSRCDAGEVAGIFEGLGRMLWDLGVRDEQPRCVKLEPDGARWSLHGVELRLARHGDFILFDLPREAVSLELVPLAEVVQVLRWLAS